MKYEKQTAVITGAGHGIGAALALALAARGMNVVVADVDAEAAATTASRVEEQGVRSLAQTVDVRDPAALESLASAAWEAFGGVHLLVNNAGVMAPQKPVWALTPEEVRWVLEVNLEGILNGLRAFVPRFLASESPCWIVNTGSEHSLGRPHLGAGAYSASKHAVLGLSDVLRGELPDHIGVSVLCPGIVSTTLWQAGKRRPESFGGPEAGAEAGKQFMEAVGMSAGEVAERTLKGIDAGEFLIPTHAHVAGIAEQRWELIRGAFERQAPRYDGDDRYDVDKAMQRLLAATRADD